MVQASSWDEDKISTRSFTGYWDLIVGCFAKCDFVELQKPFLWPSKGFENLKLVCCLISAVSIVLKFFISRASNVDVHYLKPNFARSKLFFPLPFYLLNSIFLIDRWLQRSSRYLFLIYGPFDFEETELPFFLRSLGKASRTVERPTWSMASLDFLRYISKLIEEMAGYIEVSGFYDGQVAGAQFVW